MMGVVHGHDESFKLWIKLTTGYPKMEVWKMHLLFKGAICNGSLPSRTNMDVQDDGLESR